MLVLLSAAAAADGAASRRRGSSGYGNLTPRTGAGKLATVVYALFGIPLMLLYMANVGDILATSFKYTYKKMCK